VTSEPFGITAAGDIEL